MSPMGGTCTRESESAAVEIQFAGAAREVTGSCHIVRVNGKMLALDFGLFQGRRAESEEKNRRLPFDVQELDAVVLSHAHIDHSGRLPLLMREGYQQTIWCTPATRDLCAIMLADSAHIQEKDAEHLSRHNKAHADPLYTARDAARTVEQMISVPFKKRVEILPGVQLTFVEAGHILGSASVILDCTEGDTTTRLVFSGDIGRSGLPIIRDPEPPEGADIVIMESTYGNRDHPAFEDAQARLAAIVSQTAKRGGKLLIPAFAVGRTQELVYELHALARAGKIPEIPIFIDSPLAIDATSVFEMHPDIFDRSERMVQDASNLFRFDLVRYTRDTAESKALNTMRGPMVVIAASGMAESGRILHHLLNGADDPRNTILIVGFMAEHTLGRRILEKQPVIKVFGDEVPLRAQVEVLNGYSAHGDRTDLREWIRHVRGQGSAPRTVFLVHGEAEAQDAFAEALRTDGFHVVVPSLGERVHV
ncbi:MAG: MBL fold metallo-hydrolase [Gemmatimonadaceae bacterium]|nr:MBL fold metallo-hydrolase [Gemmatimonadaceae bacterium]